MALAMRLLSSGVKVDELLPSVAIESGMDFVQELATSLKGEAKSDFDRSELGLAYREAKKAAPKSPKLPEGASVEDLRELAASNQEQAAAIATTAGETRPGCRKEIVDTLLEVFEEAVEVTRRQLAPLLTGYEGEATIASSAEARLQELRWRQANLQAQLVIMGPCQAAPWYASRALGRWGRPRSPTPCWASLRCRPPRPAW